MAIKKYQRTNQLFNKNDYIDAGNYYIGSDKIATSSNTKMLIIPCKPNTTYTVSRATAITHRLIIGFVTSQELYADMPVYGRDGSSANLTATSTSEADSAYLCIYYGKSGGSDSSTPAELQSQLDELMVNEGTTALPYQQYYDWFTTGRKYETATDTITSLPKTIIGDGHPINANMFNKDDIISGELIRSTGIVQSPSNCHSKYIAVEPDTSYYIQNGFAQSSFSAGVFFDASKNAISDILIVSSDHEFTTPNNCKYIMVNCANNAKDVFMLNKGSVPVSYQAFNSSFIKGNMTQSGTPTSSNPIYPSECGERTENLFDYNDLEDGTLSDGEPIPYLGHKRTAHFIAVKSSTTYRLSNIIGSERVSYYDNTKTYISNELIDNVFTTPSNCVFVKCSGAATGWAQTTMLTEGSTTPSSYIPYGYKLPITLGGNTYPVYLSEPIRKIGDYTDSVPSTGTASRVIKKLVLTGSEADWRVTGTGRLALVIPDLPLNETVCVCSHYKGVFKTSYSEINDGECTIERSRSEWAVYDSNYTTVDSYKQYLVDQYTNGTPVTIWYVLTTPTTETFAAPTLPTSGTAETFDVDTTLKPSEVSLTYHGWHDYSDTKYTT